MKILTKRVALILMSTVIGYYGVSQDLPKIISDKATIKNNYLPDYSYAGYHFSEEPEPQAALGTKLDVLDFGAIPDDGLDDTKAVLEALKKAQTIENNVEISFPKGRFILSSILFIERSNLVLTGAGSSEKGTTLYFPRPMRYFPDPEPLAELREYLVELDKLQKEPENNLILPFSQYAWSGGMIWTQVPKARVKQYLDKYDKDPLVLAELTSGKRGSHEISMKNASSLAAGNVVQIEWYNKDGKNGSFLSTIYGNSDVKIGSHHWNYPTHSLVQQQVLITRIAGNKVYIKDELLHDIKPEWGTKMVEWKHLEEVGIQHFNIEFPMAPNIAHHVEDGYNAIYLTNLYNGWIKDISIKNADSGILTEQIANVTISDVNTSGEKTSHYSVSMGSVHNVLVKNLTVYNRVLHPLSFNTHATKSVYQDCIVYRDPILDQHSGANHQNLFDNITVYVDLPENKLSYPLFVGGGAGYWKPSHGAYTTFWNINVHFNNGFDRSGVVLLNGMKDGPSARLIGVHASRPISITYGPDAYIEGQNKNYSEVPSLFNYQLGQRNK